MFGFSSARWSSGCVFDAPALFDAFVERHNRDARNSQALLDRLGFPVNNECGSTGFSASSNASTNSVAPLIGVLHGLRRPAAIFRTVPRIVVDTVDRVPPARMRAHIFAKCDEVILPALAYSNSSAAVIGPCCRFGVIAALSNALPCRVLTRPGTAINVSKFADSTHVGAPFTAARFSLAKPVHRQEMRASTVAPALPNYVPRFSVGIAICRADSHQFSSPLSCNVFHKRAM